jgi:hypothetical protein
VDDNAVERPGSLSQGVGDDFQPLLEPLLMLWFFRCPAAPQVLQSPYPKELQWLGVIIRIIAVQTNDVFKRLKNFKQLFV